MQAPFVEKNGKRSVDVRGPMKVDPNTLKAKGVRRDFSRHVGGWHTYIVWFDSDG